MDQDKKSILHELYVYSEWKPEPEYLQKPDNILPENISALWRWLKFFGPKKGLMDSITVFKERQQKWHIALGDEGKVIAILTDNILEIRTKRSDYATIAARTTVSRDAYSQWRKVVWSPDCSFVAIAYGNGFVSFFDFTASNLFNIPVDCSRPGGLECTDNTHAVADIIFMPLRVEDNKWSWEVLIVTYTGQLRTFLVSQTAGCTLHHTFTLTGGVGALAYSTHHDLMLVAGLPRSSKDPASPLYAGITAWRILNDDPFYKLSVVSDEFEIQLANERFQLYVPFISNKNIAFIVNMAISPDGSKLVCIHCTGEVSAWTLPLLRLIKRWPLNSQPQHDLVNPLKENIAKDVVFNPSDVNWWSNEEIILSRFSGAISVCEMSDLANILGNKPQFLEGVPRLTSAVRGAFLALECETSVLPAKRSSDDSTEIAETADSTSVLQLCVSLVRAALYSLTELESLQPRPRAVTVRARRYRLLAVRSTTSGDLFTRKIESGKYAEALALAETYNLDSDQVYQQQWRKTPVSTEAIQKYLSKVSKRIWAVHQCVDRLPETLPAAKELLQFGLKITNEEIFAEINKDRVDDHITDPDDITLDDLNAASSELLRCRHVILFYIERLQLYEAILRSEKSTYAKNEYDRLRSNSLVYSATELAKEGRIAALTCLWSYISSVSLQLTVLENFPETINPFDYKHLLQSLTERPESPEPEDEVERDWCRKQIFRSIWSSNWSEDTSPETETGEITVSLQDISKWYIKRAREMEERSGLVSHALTLIKLAYSTEVIPDLDKTLFHLTTLDTLVYDVGLEDVNLKVVVKLTLLEASHLLMKMSCPETFVSDLKQYLVPFLKRNECVTGLVHECIQGLQEYLQSLSVNDLSWILLVLQDKQFELDVMTHLQLAESCLMAHARFDQIEMVCDILATLLVDSDDSISKTSLVNRVSWLQRVVHAAGVLWWRGVNVPLAELIEYRDVPRRGALTLARLARSAAVSDEKPNEQNWERLLRDILELQENVFTDVSKEECYEIYAGALLSSDDAASIRLASGVLTTDQRDVTHVGRVTYDRSVTLVLAAAAEYCNSAAALCDPALQRASCCLSLFKEDNEEIKKENDFIEALKILNSFNLSMLPIQVRLCEDKMCLIEECLKLNPQAYLASHKLIKLAALLRIAGDDEQKREGLVCTACLRHAAEAGAGAVAEELARRVAGLRHAPAAALLHVVGTQQAHADRNTRRELFASAVTYCDPCDIEEILRSRLALELESVQQMGIALKEHAPPSERWPSIDDEFSDAITTPVVEKKELLSAKSDKNIPLFSYLLEALQNQFTTSDQKSINTETTERTVHCPEFYHSVYPHHDVSNQYYAYDCFSTPELSGQRSNVADSLLKSFYIQSALEDEGDVNLERKVVQKCAEEKLYSDTPLAVACLLRTVEPRSTAGPPHTLHCALGLSAAVYVELVTVNRVHLKEDVYVMKPVQIARKTLTEENASPEQMELIHSCLDKLMLIVEINKVKSLGYTVNTPLFTADADYRQEIISRIAESSEEEHISLALSLANKCGVLARDVWLRHAAAAVCDVTDTQRAADKVPPGDAAYLLERLKEDLWERIPGEDHNIYINYFTLVKKIDDKALIYGLTAADHIKLLKKIKATSSKLNYKLILHGGAPLSRHLRHVTRPRGLGSLTKLLRALPSVLGAPDVTDLYWGCLTDHFFDVPPYSATNKKWMQQYRQCASYFNKLSKDDLLEFLRKICFSEEAVERVPSGSRILMLTQAADYCQQEQENDSKMNKTEAPWATTGQELTRWSRFLETLHSDTVRAVLGWDRGPGDPAAGGPVSGALASGDLGRWEDWREVEMSHGSPERILPPLARLLTSLSATTLTRLLQCLHVSVTVIDVVRHALVGECDLPTLIPKITQYHREGVVLPEDLLNKVMSLASEHKLPPQQQIALLSLTQKRAVQDGDDLTKVVQFSLELFRTEWPDVEFVKKLQANDLLNDDLRRETFKKLSQLADSLQKRKALVDVLNCWPVIINDSYPHSLQCEYLDSLLLNEDKNEVLVLIKLLLVKPVLTEEEIQWITSRAQGDSIINLIWIIVLSKCETSKNNIPKLLIANKEYISIQEIDNELIKELLDADLFIKLVSTPIYSSIINFIMNGEINIGEPKSQYTVKWATNALLGANFIAEAGNLKMMALGVPQALRGFTESITYFNNLFSK